MFSVINHFENEEKLKDSFNCVYNALDNGGYFIFDIFTSAYFKKSEPTIIKEYNMAGYNLFFVREVFDKNEQSKLETKITCFCKGGDDQLYKKYTNKVDFFKFETDVIIDILKKCSFVNIEIRNINDFVTNKNGFQNDSQIFIVANKN